MRRKGRPEGSGGGGAQSVKELLRYVERFYGMNKLAEPLQVKFRREADKADIVLGNKE